VKNSKARVPAKKLKKCLVLSLRIRNDSEYLQVDSPEKPSGFAESGWPQIVWSGLRPHSGATRSKCCAADGQEGGQWQISENLSCQKLRFCNHPWNL
jgi:hypothetical protein